MISLPALEAVGEVGALRDTMYHQWLPQLQDSGDVTSNRSSGSGRQCLGREMGKCHESKQQRGGEERKST